MINTLTLYDSSIYSHLLKDNRIRLIEHPSILARYGFPFLSIYNLIELAGVQSLSCFKNRFTKLASLENLYTISSGTGLLPCTNIDIITYEVEAWHNTGARTISSIREFINSKIKKASLKYDDETIKYIYNYSQEEIKSYHFMSYTKGLLGKPDPKLKLKDARNLYFDGLSKDKLKAVYNQYCIDAINRGKGLDEKEAISIADAFIDGIAGIHSLSEKFETLLGYIKEYAEEEIDTEKPVKYYMDRCAFNAIKYINKDYFIRCGIPMKSIKMENSFFYRLQITIEDLLITDLKRDKQRPIEGSNQCDMYFACYSLYVNVLADKRTFPLLLRVPKDQFPELSFGKVNYNDFII